MDRAQDGSERATDDVEVFPQPNALRDKVRVLRPGEPDPVQRADRAVAEQGKAFLDHAREELSALRDACAEIERAPGDMSGVIARIFTIVHDLKGQGRSFGYDMITDISASLCELVRDCTVLDPSDIKIVRVHIDSLAVVFEHDLRGGGGEQGRHLLERLSGLVASRSA